MTTRIESFVANFDGNPEIHNVEQRILENLDQLIDPKIDRASDFYYHEAHGYLTSLAFDKLNISMSISGSQFDFESINALAIELDDRVEYTKAEEKKIAARLVPGKDNITAFSKFSLTTPTGETKTVDSFFKQEGKDLVLIVFGGTWCAPCMKEIPFLNEIHNDFPNVTVLNITLEEKNQFDREMQKQSIKQEYPVLLDPESVVYDKLRFLQGVPQLLVYKNDGSFLDYSLGFSSSNDPDENPLIDKFKEFLPQK